MAKLLTNTRIYGTGTVDTQLLVRGFLSAHSTSTGALQVSGGIGVSGGGFFGGTVTATNFIGNVTGASGSLTGGTAGQIPYQVSPGITSFFGPGNTGDLLISAGGGQPLFVNTTTIYVGNAVTATNVRGGAANQFIYQSAPGITAFINTGSMYVGRSTLSDNLAGGLSGQFVYQTAPNVTAFINTSSMYVGRAVIADTVAGGIGFVNTVQQNTNAAYYLTFVDSNNTSATAENVFTSSTFVVNPGTGNVGIGTTSPTAALHISSLGSAKLLITADTDNITETDVASIELSQDGGVTTANFGIDSGNNLVIGSNSTTSPNIYLGTRTDGTSFATAADAKVTILNNGNVGVGVSPSYKLDVDGVVQGRQGLRTGLGYNSYISDRLQFAASTGFSHHQFKQVDPGSGVTRLDLRRYTGTGDGFDSGEMVTFLANGNVGIGTTAPARKLQVTGDITINTVYKDFQSYSGTSNNLMRTWDGVLVAGSDNLGSETYTVIETTVPQDSYMMGGFTIDWFENYSSTNAKTSIQLGGYWNAESNGGFIGWEYTSTNPNIVPTIQVGRKSSNGNTVIILSHFNASYPIVVARDLWLGYSTGAETYGTGWAILQTSSLTGYTNLDPVVARSAQAAGAVSGTTNYVAKFTSSTALGNSQIFDNGTNVAVGFALPQKKLDVAGSGIVASFGTVFGVGSFAGIHFGYSESTLNNDLYKKSALVFERTDANNQGGNASGKIHLLLNNNSTSSAGALTDSVVTVDSDANGTIGSVRFGIGTRNPAYRLSVIHASDVWHAQFGTSGGRQIRIGGSTTNGGVIGAYNTDDNSSPAGLFLQRDGGNIGIATTDFSYTSSDNTAVVGSFTNNRVFVNGSLQLLGNNDAIVFGRGTSSFMKDEEIGFGWGGGWFMTDSTYLRVRNGASVQLYTPGTIRADSDVRAPIFYDQNNTAYYADPASTSNFNQLQVQGFNILQTLSISVTAGNWYTIATNPGNRCYATFYVWDYDSGLHGSMSFNAGVSYNSVATITMLGKSWYSGGGNFNNIRIRGSTTYDPQYLQIYANYTGTMNIAMQSNFQSAGWTLTNGGTGSPGSSTFAEVDPNSYPGLATNRNIWSGDSIYAGSSMRAPIFYDSNDSNYYGDFASTSRMNDVRPTKITRADHAQGFLEGSYNNVGGNSSYSNPIYTIGSSYNPTNSSLSNMYGVGYAHPNFWGGGKGDDWGMYVAMAGSFVGTFGCSNGSGRNTWIQGYGEATGSWRAPIFYDSNNTGYYVDGDNTSNFWNVQFLNGKWYTSNNGSGNSIDIYVRPDNNTSYVWRHIYGGTGTGYGTGVGGYGIYCQHLGGDYSLLFNPAGFVTAPYSLRSPIFYDSANTAFYLDPNAGKSLRIAGGIAQNNIVGRPYAAWGATSASGAVVVKFPGGTGNYGMIHAVIDIYEYNGNAAATVIVGGHNWNGAWYNINAEVVGQTDKPVRVAVKDGKYCIVIGNGSSSWSYGQVVLRKIQNGTYYDGIMEVAEGYTAAIESDSYSWVSGDLRNLRTPLGFTAGSAVYSPIYYDSNNTGYYLDPTSTTSIRTVGSWRADSSSWDGEFAGKIQYHSNNWYFQYTSNALFRNASGSNVTTIDSGGNLTASGFVRAGTNVYTDANYGYGLVGVYTSVRYQGVFAMGDAYKLPADGTSTGNLYGIAWSHPNAGGIAGNLASHGMLILENGSFRGAWGGGSLRTPGDVRGTLFYDWDNTGYYCDPASTSRLNVIYCGDVYNDLGGWFRNYGVTGLYNQSYAIHFYANGSSYWNLHSNNGLIIRSGYESTIRGYLYYDGSGFGLLHSSGGWAVRTTPSLVEIYNRLDAPIMYDSNNTGYYADPASTSQLNYITTRRIEFIGTGGDSGLGTQAYAIYQEGGSWSYPYPDLRIAYHTGIKLGGNAPSYEGTRVYSDYDMSDLCIQLAGGSNYSYKYKWMWTNGTGYYADINGLHLEPNQTSSYGSLMIRGNRSGWYGLMVYDGNGYRNHFMWENGNGGIYNQDTGRWVFYHDRGGNSTGLGSSSTSSSHRLYINDNSFIANMYANGFYYASDRKLKENIHTISNAVETVKKFRGVTYNKIDDKEKKLQIGLIAQEVEEIIPSLVTKTKDHNEVEYLSVNYGNIAGLLIEAVKEQSELINTLKTEIEQLKKKLGV